jgi:hypothetical protein
VLNKLEQTILSGSPYDTTKPPDINKNWNNGLGVELLTDTDGALKEGGWKYNEFQD